MHFYNLIKEIASRKKVTLFVDMDGVIALYEVNKPYDFDRKRPLTTRIEIFRELSKLDNVELHILSVCPLDSQIKEKNDWLDIHAPFFLEENRVIIPRESNGNKYAKTLKLEYLNSYKTDNQIAFIDDDNDLLRTIYQNTEGILLYQDSELVD